MIPESDRPLSLQVWRDEKKRRILVEHANGVQTEGYLFESGYVVRSTANSDNAFVSQGEGGRAAVTSLFSRDFHGTQWLDMAFYIGTEAGEDGAFYLFEQPASHPPQPIVTDAQALPTSDFDPLKYQLLSAKLHAPSKFPAEVRLGGTVYTFSPVEKWEGTVSMPQKFTQAAQEFTQELSVIEAIRNKNKNP